MSKDVSELELDYHQITELYDLAEELVATVEHEAVDDPNAQLNLVEPLINQLGDSTDVLCEAFIDVAGKGQDNAGQKTRIETNLRKIYSAIDVYKEQAGAFAHQAGLGLHNIADHIVEKIKYQVERVISVFVEFINLSLERIMQKQYIEELRRRQEKIAQMLLATEHQQAMQVGA